MGTKVGNSRDGQGKFFARGPLSSETGNDACDDGGGRGEGAMMTMRSGHVVGILTTEVISASSGSPKREVARGVEESETA